MLLRDVSHGKTSSEAKKPQCHGSMYIGNNNMMVNDIEGEKRGIRYDCDIILYTLHVNVPHKSQYN